MPSVVGTVLLAWLKTRPCWLAGPTRGSVRSHLEQRRPRELSVATGTFTSALPDTVATGQTVVPPQNLKCGKYDQGAIYSTD